MAGGAPWAGLPALRHQSGSVYILLWWESPHASPMDWVAAGVKGGSATGGGCSLGWQAPGAPSRWEPLKATNRAALMKSLNHTAVHGACAQASTHTHAQPACSPKSPRGFCPGSAGQAEGEEPRPGKDCSSPALELPPRLSHSLLLTHTIRLLARPLFIDGASWKVSCFPAGGTAWWERALLQEREGLFLPALSLPLSLVATPRPPDVDAQNQPGRQARRLPSPPLPLPHLGYSTDSTAPAPSS